MVFAKLDTGDIMTAGADQGNLPAAAGGKLEKRLDKLVTELQKAGKKGGDNASRSFNSGVREAFAEFMLSVFGGYRSFVIKPADAASSPKGKAATTGAFPYNP